MDKTNGRYGQLWTLWTRQMDDMDSYGLYGQEEWTVWTVMDINGQYRWTSRPYRPSFLSIKSLTVHTVHSSGP